MPKTIDELSRGSRDLANDLFEREGDIDCANPPKDISCIRKEDERPLTKEEKARGWARRPFSAYEPERLCLACAAYFHAEMAAQKLHELRCVQGRTAAKARVVADHPAA